MYTSLGFPIKKKETVNVCMYVGLFVVVMIQHPEKHLKLRTKQYSVHFCAECSLDMHPGEGGGGMMFSN